MRNTLDVKDRLVVLLGQHLECGETLLSHIHALDHLNFSRKVGMASMMTAMLLGRASIM